MILPLHEMTFKEYINTAEDIEVVQRLLLLSQTVGLVFLRVNLYTLSPRLIL